MLPRSNKRNYYRILHVQPDASLAVIRASYRTLLQTLRAHPDLGGDHWNAALINEAYATLRHPARRRKYDADLLSRYDVQTLSMGRFAANTQPSAPNRRNTGSNDRNFYRLLGVQRDAPAALITATYRALKRSGAIATPLLDEAHTVLADQSERARYDALLHAHRHSDALTHLRAQPQRVRRGLHSTIGRYCPFCKTPAMAAHGNARWCVECESPLPDKGARGALPAQVRDAARLMQAGAITLYTYWPAPPLVGRVEDLSPTGAGITVRGRITTGMTVKLEAPRVSALARVTRVQPFRDGTSRVGLEFLSARFDRHGGNFLDISA